MSEKRDNIDWESKSNTLEIIEMWEELNRKIKSTTKNIPAVIIKNSINKEVQLKNYLWRRIDYLVKEKKMIKLREN